MSSASGLFSGRAPAQKSGGETAEERYGNKTTGAAHGLAIFGKTKDKIVAGTRALTKEEERRLLQVVRKMGPRNRALVTIQWFTGFRISEVLSLTVGSVERAREIVDKIGVAPRYLKGKRGATRWVPVLPEMGRALRHLLWWLRLKYEVTPALPLFPSRQREPDGTVRAISRMQAHEIVRQAFTAAGMKDDGRLGTHALRKTFARRVYVNSGHDLLVVKAALQHADVATTQQYLEVDGDTVVSAIWGCDFTRQSSEEKRKLA